MEQKYRDIDIKKDVRMDGDETSEENTDEWSPIGRNNIGRSYSETRVIRLKYRRPITQQYVYENAGFMNDFDSFCEVAKAINDGHKFYTDEGAEAGLFFQGGVAHLKAGSELIHPAWLHTRKPAPRMMEINGAELVAPETVEPEIGTDYYSMSHTGEVVCHQWGNGAVFDHKQLKTGIWLKEEHCKQVIDALQKVFFGGEV